MSPLVALVVGLVLGGAVAATVILRFPQRPPPMPAAPGVALPEAALARRLLDLMDPAVVVLDVDDAVVLANPAARAMGIVRGTRLVVPELLDLGPDRAQRAAAAGSTSGCPATWSAPGPA